MGSVNVNIPPGNNQVPTLTVSYYIPAPPILPPPPIKKPVVFCSDNLSQALSARYLERPLTLRARFCYTPAQCDLVAKRKVLNALGLQDSRTIVVPFHEELSIGQIVSLDDDSGGYFYGSVYGIEINQTGRLATKTVVIKKLYDLE